MSEEKAEYMNSPVDELKMCASCSDTGTTEGFNRWTLEPCVVFCDCPKGEAKKEQRRQELQSKNTRAESPDSVETCDYCNARLNAASECDNDECDVFEYKPTPPVAGGVVISREDAEEVLAYCNADFIAQGALLNSCVLQTLTAKAIVEGRRCRMGAIAAKLEAALGERNNG